MREKGREKELKWSEKAWPSNYPVAEVEICITIYIQQTEEQLQSTLVSAVLFHVTCLHDQTQMECCFTPFRIFICIGVYIISCYIEGSGEYEAVPTSLPVLTNGNMRGGRSFQDERQLVTEQLLVIQVVYWIWCYAYHRGQGQRNVLKNINSQIT
jgi:hypothetical protein